MIKSIKLSELKKKPVSVERLIELSNLQDKPIDLSDLPEQTHEDFKDFKPLYKEQSIAPSH